MRMYCCYYAEFVENEENETLEELHFLNQLGVYKTQKGAYDALVAWARELWGKDCMIREIEGDGCIFVNKVVGLGFYTDKYCIRAVDFHEE